MKCFFFVFVLPATKIAIAIKSHSNLKFINDKRELRFGSGIEMFAEAKHRQPSE